MNDIYQLPTDMNNELQLPWIMNADCHEWPMQTTINDECQLPWIINANCQEWRIPTAYCPEWWMLTAMNDKSWMMNEMNNECWQLIAVNNYCSDKELCIISTVVAIGYLFDVVFIYFLIVNYHLVIYKPNH